MKLCLRRFLLFLIISLGWGSGALAAKGRVFDASSFQYSSPWELKTSVKNAFEGHLLVFPAGQETTEIRLTPDLRGPYRIVLGLHYQKFDQVDEQYFGPAILARLDNDPYRVFLSTTKPFAAVEFKVADMTGRSLILAPLSKRPAFLDYVRFEPVTPEEFQAIEEQRLAPHQQDVVGIHDVNVWLWRYTSRSAQDFRDMVGQHLWAGFNRVYWMANAGALFYHSRVGTPYRGDNRPFTSRSGYMVEHFRPLEDGVKAAREMGLELWGWYRLNNNFGSPAELQAYGPGLNSEFFMQHPEYRLVRADGSVDPSKYSFAYPEVRAYVRRICVEMVQKGVAGLMLDLLRHPPLAGYEPPLIKGYWQKYGVDPRTIKPTDTAAYNQWTAYRARNSFTQFVIELSEDLKRLGISVPLGIRCGLTSFSWNLEQGMDVEDLVHRGLLREICLMNGYLSKPQFLLAPEQIAAASQPYFDLCRGRPIRLICGLHGRSPAEILKYAKFIDQAGYAGVAIYESGNLLNQPQYLEVFRKLKFRQTVDEPWITVSSARNKQLVPWQPASTPAGAWWQLNLPQSDHLSRITLHFDHAPATLPVITVSEDGSHWQQIPGVLRSEREGWLNIETDLPARLVRVTLAGTKAQAPKLVQAQCDFQTAGSIHIGEVHDGRVRIASPKDAAEVKPGVTFEAEVAGSPQSSNVEFYWDGVLIRTEHEAPYTWFTDASLRPGLHTLKVRLADNPLAPSVDEIEVRVAGRQVAPEPPPASERLIASENFESLPEGSTELPKGWYFSKGLYQTYTRGKAEGSVRVEQAGGSKALRITWSGIGPRMYVNFDFGGPVRKGTVEFDVMVPDAGNQRLAGLFEGSALNLAMYLVDRGGRMTYNLGVQSHQNFSPPVAVKPGSWRHIKWAWDSTRASQTIYIDDMQIPLVDGPGIRKRPQKGIDRFGFFFFENQQAEVIVDNIKAFRTIDNHNNIKIKY